MPSPALPSHKWALLLLFVVSSVTSADPADQQRCAERLQTEQTRIQRDFARERPPPSDKEAHDKWAKNLHVALTAAGRAAEACERQSRLPLTPDRKATLDSCIAEVNRKNEEIARRYSGNSLSPGEQAKRRVEEQALLDQRSACVQAQRK